MMLTDVGNNRKQLMEIIGKIIADCMQEHKIKMKVFMN